MDYTIREGWLYKLNHLCVSYIEDCLILIYEARASSCGGYFGTTKTILNLHFHFYLPALSKQMEKSICTCSRYLQSKSSTT